MLDIDVPGWKRLRISSLVVDLNGTLTEGGVLLDGVESRLNALRQQVAVHLVTADVRGNGAEIAGRLGLTLHIIEHGNEAAQKAEIVRSLDAERTIGIGNGANDAELLRVAAVGVAVLGPEGMATELLASGDVVAPSIRDALDIFLDPDRLIATLRR